ncbi:MAG: endolytic transglycosylase MltG [bacterium]|nr:endolytic transglycosylase MltG [bacterium]
MINLLLRKYNYLTIATLVAIVLISIFTVYFLYSPTVRLDTNPIEIIIEEGDGLVTVAEKLDNAGLIRNKLFFVVYVKIRGEEDDLRAGRYILSKSLNIPTIAELIVSGKSKPDDIKVILTEGSNIWEIDDKLVQAQLIYEGQFSFQYYDMEGYLFPDTYSLSNQRSTINNQQQNRAEELVGKMTDNFNNKTAELLGGLSLAESREVIIIASILEKEAREKEDMKLVSGIIRKRLELDMPLQVDATVIYGACLRNFQQPTTNSQQRKNCDVTFQSPAAEIKIDGPYNTYTRKGLPPVPISNPGLKAIEASLNPTPSDFLYYLSTRDGSQMIYSKTPGEHAANRKKYLGI